MKVSLTDFLICLDCAGPLRLDIEREDRTLPWSEVLEGRLLCDQCGDLYPVTRGVPRMIRGSLAGDVAKTVTGFGYEWQNFDERIADTYMTDKTNFLDFIAPVTPEHFQGKVVLDAGCGMGRFLKLGANFGSQAIIGVDLSDSVDIAYQHARALPNAHVVQADIMALPFRPDSFNYIFSVGVLQFLPSPRAGFDQLTGLLQAGGSVSIWVYAEENNNWIIRLVTPFRQHVTSRLPRPLLLAVCYLLGLVLHPIIQLIYKPANEGKLGKLSNYLPYNDYLYYSSRLSYAAIVSVVFDHLVPSLVTYLSRETLAGWFPADRFDQLTITSRNNMSWRAFAVYAPTNSLERV